MAKRVGIAFVVTHLSKAHESDDNRVVVVIDGMVADSNTFRREATMRLERAIASAKPHALLDEIDSPLRSERFRHRLEEVTASTRPRIR